MVRNSLVAITAGGKVQLSSYKQLASNVADVLCKVTSSINMYFTGVTLT